MWSREGKTCLSLCYMRRNSKTDDDGRVSLQWDRPESGGRAAEVMAQERSRADGAL